MASKNCTVKACRMVWCCVTGATPGDTTGTTGNEKPIGLVRDSSLNTSETDGDASSYMGGSYSDNQTPINFDANGIPDDNSRYLGDDGNYYDLCGGSSSTCDDEITLNADFCLALKDGTCNGGQTDDAQTDLICQQVKHLRLKYINEFGQSIPVYDAPDATINSKNRALSGGSNATFDVSITVEGGGRYLNCFH